MAQNSDSRALTLDIPSNLDAGTVSQVHASLIAALDLAEAGDAEVALTLGDETEACAVLALQLLASAQRSFPTGTLKIDARGTRALATLKNT